MTPVSTVGTETRNILENISKESSFAVLLESLKTTGLAELLTREGPFTFFAPTNTAFYRFLSGSPDELLDNVPELTELLSYHIVPGEFRDTDLRGLPLLKTLLGQDLSIDTSYGLSVNGVEVVESNRECSNGILHTINAILLPNKVHGAYK